MTGNQLSRRTSFILKYLKEYKAAHDGQSPTTRQICEATGITSTSMVHFYLRALEEMGLITIEHEGTQRWIRLNSTMEKP